MHVISLKLCLIWIMVISVDNPFHISVIKRFHLPLAFMPIQFEINPTKNEHLL